MSAPIELSAKDLVVRYDTTVALNIRHLSHEGQVFGIVGHNGSGKSTSIKTMLQLLTPDTGSFHCHDALQPDRPKLVPELHMAYSPETGAVFADVRVIDYIKLWCRIKHRDADYYKKEGSKYIDALMIAPLMEKLGRELSKGQRRRVQTAAGFLCNPRLFLFDEPFDGLDIQQSSYIAQLMTDAAHEMALVVSSHRMDVVERICDVVIVLDDGKVTASGPVEQVSHDLSGRSIFIEGIDHAEPLIDRLKEELPKAFFAHIGTQLRVVGKAVSTEKVRNALATVSDRQFEIASGQSSLIDAMSYHLQSSLFAEEESQNEQRS